MLRNTWDSSGSPERFKRKQNRRRINTVQRRGFAAVHVEKKPCVRVFSTGLPRSFNSFSTVAFLTCPRGGLYALQTGDDSAKWRRCGGRWRGRLRPSRSSLASATALSAAGPSSVSGDGGEAAAADAVLYRVFLKDGGVLVSYGEFASVADKVVLSMPIGGTDAAPVLHLISIRRKGRRVGAHQCLRAGGAGAPLRRHAGARTISRA